MKRARLFFLALTSALVVRLVGARGLVVTPTQLGLVGKPGATVSGVIRVGAAREEKTAVKVTVTDFTKDEDGQLRENPPSGVARSCRNWLRVDQENFFAPGGGMAELRVTARIPADAQGSYWALVGLEVPPPPRKPGAGTLGIAVVPRVAVGVFVTADGTVKRQVRVAAITAHKKADEPVEVVATIENAGNAAVLVSGSFTLERPGTKGADTVELASKDVGPVTSLPGNRLRLRAKLDWTGSVADLQVHSYLRYGPEPEDGAESATSIEVEGPAAPKPGGERLIPETPLTSTPVPTWPPR